MNIPDDVLVEARRLLVEAQDNPPRPLGDIDEWHDLSEDYCLHLYSEGPDWRVTGKIHPIGRDGYMRTLFDVWTNV